jgi:crossover junction endodeoxyribonuclease RuvC
VVATRILGIDPGSHVTGYGVLESRGASLRLVSMGGIRPPARLDFSSRLLYIADALAALIGEVNPQEAAVEDLFHALNARSALKLAHLRGVVLAEIARGGVRLFEYAPRAVKKAVTGSGGADKEQVRGMVGRLLQQSFDRAPYDLSDALAVAICHAHSRGRPSW